MNWHPAVDPVPAILVLPGDAASLDEAHAAIQLWEHYSGKTLDGPQRLTVEILMAQNSRGLWAAATTGRCEPRQNGKGDEIEVVELWGLVQRSEAILHTVHDAVLLASQAQQRMLAVVEGHSDLRRLIKRKWLGTGQQMIEFRHGGTIWYRTRTGGGGRGVDDIDRLVVDEAQHAQDEHLAALTPTMLANENAQMNALGSAGIDGKSAWWWRMRLRALGPEPGDLGFIEHSAETVTLDESGFPIQTPVDPTDRASWAQANPALHAGRGQGLSFFEEQFRRLDQRSFLREHLGVWDAPPIELGNGFLPAGDWLACRDIDHTPSGHLCYALDVSPDARSCAVAMADGSHVEIVKHAPGTAWVVDACTAKRGRFSEIVLDPAGPAGLLVAPLEAAGITVRKVSTEEAKAACASFLTAVVDRTLIHRGQPELDQAIANADRRAVGDGGWLWSRKRSSVDISPLYAATFATWAAGVGTKRKPTFAH